MKSAAILDIDKRRQLTACESVVEGSFLGMF